MFFGEPVERYEAWDIDSGDVLVMYRVPYKAENEPVSEAPAVPNPRSLVLADDDPQFVVELARIPSLPMDNETR